jgi:hypothetical protein
MFKAFVEKALGATGGLARFLRLPRRQQQKMKRSIDHSSKQAGRTKSMLDVIETLWSSFWDFILLVGVLVIMLNVALLNTIFKK